MSNDTATKRIDPTNPPKTTYCIPLWLRDLQIKHAISLGLPTVQPSPHPTGEPIALVSYGPSLNDTWEQIKDFKVVMTCSGAHRFLIDRGIIPTYHVAVDPLEGNTPKLIGEPHPDVQYLIASTCHPDVFAHLTHAQVKIWHVYDGDAEATPHPPNEWALTGGCSVGVRMLTMSRFLGYVNLHVFGMDGCEGASGKHAGVHPAQPKGHSLVTVDGREFKTTSSMFAVAAGIGHEMDMLADATVKFYGDGLIQWMYRNYERKALTSVPTLAANSYELISTEYKALNKQLHHTNVLYGTSARKHVQIVKDLITNMSATSVLDYGCGKGLLGKLLDRPIWEYDPAIPGKDEPPRPADLVTCIDVLEHIEPDKLMAVLNDLRRVVKQVGYFVVSTTPSSKTLPDGRNAHLIQKHQQWWHNRIATFFTVNMCKAKKGELYFVVTPKQKMKEAA